ncbi:uncharacterized protein EKO05_0008854 [Ascochyta rabiei]|uniref:uncharacterized protein n=1 Tax=Didymella rabiei TaxID=5454 RepID=UPI00220B3D9A|nr:uncharacterized protein EKO05_0008854 [Ascochyta rabiei]UPX18559.1 hypothetical protein EKO05_0008854 [Ascochyta rabiei]
MLVPDDECFAANVTWTYNVIELYEYERDFPKYLRDFPKYLRDFPKYLRDFPKYLRDFPKFLRDFPKYLRDPKCRKRNAWSYMDAETWARFCHGCVDKDGLGFQVFNAINDTITATLTTRHFLEQWCPNTPITRELEAWEAPMSNKKIWDVLGFREEHDWKKYYHPGSVLQ